MNNKYVLVYFMSDMSKKYTDIQLYCDTKC